MSANLPSNLRYTKQHEWAQQDGDVVVVGITAHAVEQLGDITLVTLPATGTYVQQNAPFGDIDSVKAVSELFAPVSGEIIEHNTALEHSPELVNGDPYGSGWMVKIRMNNPDELGGSMSAAEYQKFLAEST